MSDIILNVTGLDVLQKNMDELGDELTNGLAPAGDEIAREILDTEGLRKYPAMTAANQPGRYKMVTFSNGKTANFRMGYYVRGEGAFSPVRGGGYRMTHSSERYGTSFTTETTTGNGLTTTIGNDTSYGHWVGGEDQAHAMAGIGWRKLYDVAVDKIGKLTTILQAYIDRIIQRNNLS